MTVDMQITNSKVCDQVNVGLYKQIKPPLVGEYGSGGSKFCIQWDVCPYLWAI